MRKRDVEKYAWILQASSNLEMTHFDCCFFTKWLLFTPFSWFPFISNVDKLVTFKCSISSTNYSPLFPENFSHSSLDFIFKFKEEKIKGNYWLISFSLICFWSRFAIFSNDFILHIFWCPSRAATNSVTRAKKGPRENHK